MVTDHDECHVAPGAALIDSRQQAAQFGVLALQGFHYLGRIWAVTMSLGICPMPPTHDQPRPLIGGQIEPGQDLVDLFAFGHLRIERRAVVVNRLTSPGLLAPHPEKCRRPHALALGRRPERLGFEPAVIRAAAVVVKALLPIPEAVVQNAVTVGIGTRCQGNMIGKSVRRKNRTHSSSPHSLAFHPIQRGNFTALGVIVPQTIKGEDNDRGSRLGRKRSEQRKRKNEKSSAPPPGACSGPVFPVLPAGATDERFPKIPRHFRVQSVGISGSDLNWSSSWRSRRAQLSKSWRTAPALETGLLS